MDNKNKYYLETDSPTLTKWDILIPTIHISVGLLFYYTYQQQYFDIETFKNLVSGYYFMTTFLLLVGYYRELRDLRIFIIWTFIGIGQLFVYYLTKDISDFKMFRGTSMDDLRSLIIMLAVFQACRQISLRLTKDEFIVTYKRFSKFDEEDGRKITWVDTVLSLIASLGTIFGNLV